MTTPDRQPVFFSRPRDESLQAFKDWILEFTEKLTGKPAKSAMTEKEWEQKWRAFWDQAKGKESSDF